MNATRPDYVFFSRRGKAQVRVLNGRVRRTGIFVDSVIFLRRSALLATDLHTVRGDFGSEGCGGAWLVRLYLGAQWQTPKLRMPDYEVGARYVDLWVRDVDARSSQIVYK